MKKVFRSTIYQIVALIIILVLPINLLTLYLSQLLQDSTYEKMVENLNVSLISNAEHINEELVKSTRSLRYLSLQETDFISMGNITDVNESQDSGAYLASIKRQLKLTHSSYQEVDMLYFYFPQSQYFVANGYISTSFQQLRTYIVENFEANIKQNTWEVKEIDNVYVLIGYYKWSNSCFGVVQNLERMVSRINIPDSSSENIIFLADDAGNVYTKDGINFFEQTGYTMDTVNESGIYEMYSQPINQTPLSIVKIVNVKNQFDPLLKVINGLQLISVLLLIAVIPLLLFYIQKRIIKPLNRLVKAIGKIEQGDLDYRIRSIKDGHEFDTINRNFNNMLDLVTKLKIDALKNELEKKDIQINYLSQQIEPHFFLNAMNIIYSYEPEEYPLIQRMVANISKYFRYIVKVNAHFVTLAQEMAHIENYFEIQKVRFEDLFSYKVVYDKELECALIPPLLVQNFAENAIKYSLKSNECSVITIDAFLLTEDRFCITVTDTGDGLSDEMLQGIENFQKNGIKQDCFGVGLQNSIERLKLLYQDKGKITFSRNEKPSGTIVRIELPLYKKETNDESIAN